MIELLDSVHVNYWAVQVLVIILITLISNRISKEILQKLHKKFKKTQNIWDITFIEALRKPLHFFILTIGVTLCAQFVYTEFDIELLSLLHSAQNIAIITLIGWFLVSFIKKAQTNIIKHRKKNDESKISRTDIDVIGNISTILVVIAVALMGLQTMGFEIGGLLTLGGVGGIAIGFAAKDLLSNFFGGLMIYFDRPFQIGDWVRSPDKEIEGTVVKIGWRQTQIKTFDHRPLYVPNSVFSTIVVENPSRMTNRRIYETIGVRYDDMSKMNKIITDIKKMLTTSKEIDQAQTIIVNVNTFAASSINFFIYASTVTTDWVEFHEIKQNILLKIATIIEKNEAQISLPASNIRLTREDNQEFTPFSK